MLARCRDGLTRVSGAASPKRATIAVVAALVALVDWSTKAVAAIALDDGAVALGSAITLRLGHNPGVAFGLGDRLPGSVVIAVTELVTLVMAGAAFRGSFPSNVAAGLVLGGAVANLTDRLIGGTVVDFLDVGWWPSFNAADIALSVGCALLLVSSLRASPPVHA